MIVAIVHPYFDVTGGAEMTSLTLIETLLKNKIKTRLYCIKPPKLNKFQFLEIHMTRQLIFPLFWRLQKMKEIKYLFHSLSNEDIVFVTSGGLTIGKTNVKKIYIYCHSSFSSEKKFLENKNYGVKGIYFKIIQKYLRDSFQYLKNENVKLIVNSEYTKKEIEKNLHKKSTVIYPPVDVDEFSKLMGFMKQNKVITISRFSEEKNLGLVIEIFHKVSAPCELIGNVKHKNQIRIFNQLNSKKSINTKIYQNISQTEIIDVLKSAKVYLHTAKETFGISVIESIAAGCIPIVPDNSAHRETVPFEELRYKEDDVVDAQNKIEQAIRGDFDFLLPKLHMHIQKFSKENFQKSIMQLIENDYRL